ncbi:hypothetical protein Fmac_029177 [Flemingia macrophylla]|uniref:Uncharacterized protein n=1 Tax=Flemingia macrophylla TaxID=520843 RepID=A0ABD1LA53_9FABA
MDLRDLCYPIQVSQAHLRDMSNFVSQKFLRDQATIPPRGPPASFERDIRFDILLFWSPHCFLGCDTGKTSVLPAAQAFLVNFTHTVAKLKSFKLPVYVETFNNEFVSQAWDYYHRELMVQDPILPTYILHKAFFSSQANDKQTNNLHNEEKRNVHHVVHPPEHDSGFDGHFVVVHSCLAKLFVQQEEE